MTIAISIQVNDGLVLGADSASTILTRSPDGSNVRVLNVYDNVNKVFNVHKSLPVGVVTWGAGSIGSASISTLVKDFRTKITNENSIDQATYTVKEIADAFYAFIYIEKYVPEFSTWNEDQRPALGFIIGGYSAGETLCEQWAIEIPAGGKCDGPTIACDKNRPGTITWNGVEEPLWRVLRGYSSMVPKALLDAGFTQFEVDKVTGTLDASLHPGIVIPPMPIQDVIDVVEFLIDYTEKYVKYAPGPNTVGGPIEIAAITKHEGYKWIKRKLYFDVKYNPEG